MEKLFDEILEEIFDYLDLSSLKVAIDVSMRWSSVIKSSIRIGQKFTITINIETEQPTVHIPIDGLKYGSIIFKGNLNSSKTRSIKNQVFEDLIKPLQKYQDSIRKATFCNFIAPRAVNLWLYKINHLVIYQRTNTVVGQVCCYDDKDWIFAYTFTYRFNDLKRVEFDVDKCNEDLVFKWIMNFVRPTHFKYYVRQMINHIGDIFSADKHFYAISTDCKTPIIKELKYRSTKNRAHSAVYKMIKESKNLATLQLELRDIDDEILELIRSRNKKGYTWNKLIFKNVDGDNEIVNHILDSHQDISILTFDYEQPSEIHLISGVKNIQKITFNFPNDETKSFDNFKHICELEIRRMDNQTQFQKLINFLPYSPSIKILKINRISSRVNLNHQNIKTLLIIVKSLEEIHLDAYSDYLDINEETFKTIKLEGKNLKKISVTVDFKKVEEMREKIKIFNDTKVRAIVMGKEIVPTCLENVDKIQINQAEPACVWMR